MGVFEAQVLLEERHQEESERLMRSVGYSNVQILVIKLKIRYKYDC